MILHLDQAILSDPVDEVIATYNPENTNLLWKGSISVSRLTSRLIGLESTKHINLLLI